MYTFSVDVSSSSHVLRSKSWFFISIHRQIHVLVHMHMHMENLCCLYVFKFQLRRSAKPCCHAYAVRVSRVTVYTCTFCACVWIMVPVVFFFFFALDIFNGSFSTSNWTLVCSDGMHPILFSFYSVMMRAAFLRHLNNHFRILFPVALESVQNLNRLDSLPYYKYTSSSSIVQHLQFIHSLTVMFWIATKPIQRI